MSASSIPSSPAKGNISEDEEALQLDLEPTDRVEDVPAFEDNELVVEYQDFGHGQDQFCGEWYRAVFLIGSQWVVLWDAERRPFYFSNQSGVRTYQRPEDLQGYPHVNLEELESTSPHPPKRGATVYHGLTVPFEEPSCVLPSTSTATTSTATPMDTTASDPPQAGTSKDVSKNTPLDPARTAEASITVLQNEIKRLQGRLGQQAGDVTLLKSQVNELFSRVGSIQSSPQERGREAKPGKGKRSFAEVAVKSTPAKGASRDTSQHSVASSKPGGKKFKKGIPAPAPQTTDDKRGSKKPVKPLLGHPKKPGSTAKKAPDGKFKIPRIDSKADAAKPGSSKDIPKGGVKGSKPKPTKSRSPSGSRESKASYKDDQGRYIGPTGPVANPNLAKVVPLSSKTAFPFLPDVDRTPAPTERQNYIYSESFSLEPELWSKACQKCGNASHRTGQCYASARCKYPLCPVKAAHTVRVCPTLRNACPTCKVRGHAQGRHCTLPLADLRAMWELWADEVTDGPPHRGHMPSWGFYLFDGELVARLFKLRNHHYHQLLRLSPSQGKSLVAGCIWPSSEEMNLVRDLVKPTGN